MQVCADTAASPCIQTSGIGRRGRGAGQEDLYVSLFVRSEEINSVVTCEFMLLSAFGDN